MGIFGVGRHNFGRRPKPRPAKDLTETGNRARKVSGTQGNLLGADHYFLTRWRGAWFAKFWNKLFAKAVNTEINCMQAKKMRLQEDGDTKKLFAAGAAYKTMFECEHFPTSLPPPPVKKIMVPSPRPAGPHGELRGNSFLFSPPISPFHSFLLFYFVLFFALIPTSRRNHPETLATQDKRCLHITFFFSLVALVPFFYH